MPITVSEFLAILEKLAPAVLAEEWDACGLQAGSTSRETGAVLISLNVTDAVIDEATACGCSLILSHHPMIFRPLAAVSDETEAGRLVRRATREDIAIVSAHTNLDAAPGGLADIMAAMLELADVEPLVSPASRSMNKLVVFVPEGDLDPVRHALFDAGAGVIGDYRHCSWYVSGTGTFLPVEGASPTIGSVGADESVTEYRLETLVPADCLEAAVAAMIAAHSYEEPAYDIYPVVTISRGTAAGRVGELPRTTTVAELARHVGALFGAGELRYTEPPGPVRRVAVVPGSGAGLIRELAGRADVLVTGDIKYHDPFQASGAGIGLIDLPHDVSETAALERWLPKLARELEGTGVELHMSSVATSSWKTASPDGQGAASMEDMDMSGTFRLHVDGGARGNPGPAAIGAVLLDGEGNSIASHSEAIGEATNNVAEYRALIAGVELALENGVERLEIFSDSELVVKQLEGSYRVKNEGLKPLHGQAGSILNRLESYRLTAIPREENAIADSLVNAALDGVSG